MKVMEIKKGDKFKCIQNLTGSDNKSIAFKKGMVYESIHDGYIINEQGYEIHDWRNVASEFFMKINDDRVNHPSHYTWLKELAGIEVIDITRHMDFDLGNAIKYILRNGHKSEEGISDKDKSIEDLEKAIWYINDKIKMLRNK